MWSQWTIIRKQNNVFHRRGEMCAFLWLGGCFAPNFFIRFEKRLAQFSLKNQGLSNSHNWWEAHHVKTYNIAAFHWIFVTTPKVGIFNFPT